MSRRKTTIVILGGLLALCVLSAGLLLSEEKKDDEAFQREKARAKREMKYGAWWGFGHGYTTLPLGKCFKFFYENWMKEFGENPYRNSASPSAAYEQFYNYWLDVQLYYIKENLNWELVARDGPYFTFRCNERSLVNPPEYMYNDYPEPPSMSDATKGLAFPPMTTPLDPDRYGKWAETTYNGRPFLVPPPAWSIRIYAPIRLNPTVCYFMDKYLNTPKAKEQLYDIRYDMNAMNVIRVYFRRRLPKFDNMIDPLRDQFWRWRQLALYIGRVEYEGVGWIAWEFLDEHGKPLPADYPLPTRWFPDRFEEIFKPIPLPDNIPDEVKPIPDV